MHLLLSGANYIKTILKICSKIKLEHLSFSNYGNGIIENEDSIKKSEEFWNVKRLEIIGGNSDIFKFLNKMSKMEHLTLCGYNRLDDTTHLTEKLKFLPGLRSFITYEVLINDTLIQAVCKNLLIFMHSSKTFQSV